MVLARGAPVRPEGRIGCAPGRYQLRTNGGRPVQWFLGGGWGIYIHQPLGTFDFTGDPSDEVHPHNHGSAGFLVARRPGEIMRAYAEITGFPEMIPVVAGLHAVATHACGPDQILSVAKTFRYKFPATR